MSAPWAARERLLFLALFDVYTSLTPQQSDVFCRLDRIVDAFLKGQMAEKFGHLATAFDLDIKQQKDTAKLQEAIEAESKRFADNVNAIIAARK